MRGLAVALTDKIDDGRRCLIGAAEASAVAGDTAAEAGIEPDGRGVVGQTIELDAMVLLLIGFVDESAEKLLADFAATVVGVDTAVTDSNSVEIALASLLHEPFDVFGDGAVGVGAECLLVGIVVM